MPISHLLFYFFATIVVVSALLVLFTRNVLYAAFMLIFTFLGVAAIYVLAGADFIAITQIIVYIGGILVLMIFGLMLTNKMAGRAVQTASHNLLWGSLAGVGMLFILVLIILSVNFEKLDWIQYASRQGVISHSSTVQPIGKLLMSSYVLPFELAGVLLLIALVGAAFISKRPTDEV
jgi:NADH:ubiquinone oxidoreductase subunit 6 (subunit J)